MAGRLLRKFFVTLLSVSLLAGLFLAGTMPVMATPRVEQTATAPVDCADHASRPKTMEQRPIEHGPMEHKQSGRDGPSCCMTGYCPMLAQALMPANVIQQPSPVGSLLWPIPAAFHRSIAGGPQLRPPRHFL